MAGSVVDWRAELLADPVLSVDEIAGHYGLRPTDLVELGVCDAVISAPGPDGIGTGFADAVARAVAEQSRRDPARRRGSREHRWSGALPGVLGDPPTTTS